MNSPVKKLNLPKTGDVTNVGVEPEYNRRVLIVEDEPAIAEGIKAILSPSGSVTPLRQSSRSTARADLNSVPLAESRFEVVWAKTPADAIAQMKTSLENNRPFAMGFFDVLLNADIDGIELVRRLQQMDSRIFSVFVTAYHDRSVDSINQILGGNKSDRWDYINKPFSDGEILQKARNAVALWNLKRQKDIQDERLAEASRLLLQGERANTVAAVGRSVAHEFGNILMQIVGNAEMALLKKDTERMKQALENILKASETASSVLGKFKKIHGEGGSQLAPISVNQSLDEAVELMSHEFAKRSIKVTRVKLDHCVIPASHHSLVQVFMNIFINATHAMPKSGQIDLMVVKLNDDWIEIRIRDYGPGIPENILPRVTEALFTTKGELGTGLGLAICKEIVEIEHRGEFIIANHPAKGAEVTIRLPRKDSSSEE